MSFNNNIAAPTPVGNFIQHQHAQQHQQIAPAAPSVAEPMVLIPASAFGLQLQNPSSPQQNNQQQQPQHFLPPPPQPPVHAPITQQYQASPLPTNQQGPQPQYVLVKPMEGGRVMNSASPPGVPPMQSGHCPVSSSISAPPTVANNTNTMMVAWTPQVPAPQANNPFAGVPVVQQQQQQQFQLPVQFQPTTAALLPQGGVLQQQQQPVASYPNNNTTTNAAIAPISPVLVASSEFGATPPVAMIHQSQQPQQVFASAPQHAALPEDVSSSFPTLSYQANAKFPECLEPGFVDTEGYKQIIVNYISHQVRSAELKALFAQYGPVEKARILYDGASGGTKGFGFVHFQFHRSAERAMAELQGLPLKGKTLKLAYAIQREKGQRRRSSGQSGDASSGDAMSDKQNNHHLPSSPMSFASSNEIPSSTGITQIPPPVAATPSAAVAGGITLPTSGVCIAPAAEGTTTILGTTLSSSTLNTSYGGGFNGMSASSTPSQTASAAAVVAAPLSSELAVVNRNNSSNKTTTSSSNSGSPMSQAEEEHIINNLLPASLQL